jgi:hypothetical protein
MWLHKSEEVVHSLQDILNIVDDRLIIYRRQGEKLILLCLKWKTLIARRHRIQ